MKIPEEILKEGIVIDKENNQFLVKELLFKDFIFQGLYLGNLQKPSLPLCYELSKTDFPRVVISMRAAEKFTHGENIYRKAISKGNLTGEVLVMNKIGDCLGFARWKDDLLVRVRDVGEFLRTEKEKLLV